MKYERFNAVANILGSDFYVRENSDYGREPMQTFAILHKYMTSLEARQRELNRASLRADLLQKRSHVSGIEFRHLMQADFVLFLRAGFNVLKYKKGEQWFPESLLYTYEHHGPFEIFARAQSLSYFNKLKPILAIDDKIELEAIIPKFGHQNAELWLPRWHMHAVPLEQLLGIGKIATRP